MRSANYQNLESQILGLVYIGVTKASVTQTMPLRCNRSAADFIVTDWQSLRLLLPLYVHIWNKGTIADQSVIGFATCQRLIGNLSKTVSRRYGNRLSIYWDQSMTSRQMFCDWLQRYGDWSVTRWQSIIDWNNMHIKMCLSESKCFSARWQDFNSRTVAVVAPAKNKSKGCSCIFWWLCSASSLISHRKVAASLQSVSAFLYTKLIAIQLENNLQWK